jgi:predicted nuclease with TOPRIM domain
MTGRVEKEVEGSLESNVREGGKMTIEERLVRLEGHVNQLLDNQSRVMKNALTIHDDYRKLEDRIQLLEKELTKLHEGGN